ncbi:InlB B-repeat-containing protein, partial [Candidatus Saccharibacteria bacterium]|nr:InlB B-repeat-containing protein [Candidatus Saccharibacteria bacterium]
TTNTLTSRDIAFDDTIDLSTISSSSVIARTGYTLTGWKDQNNNSYGITGTVDVNPDDLSSVTLTALWTANTYTIAYAAGSTGGTCSVTGTSATYDQNVTLSSTKCTKSGYEQKGWSTSSSASNTKTYNLGQTLTKPNLTATNGGTVTLYPYFESAVVSMQSFSCASLSAGETATLNDARDNNTYTVIRMPITSASGQVAMSGKCLMTENLKFGYSLLSSKTSGSTVTVNSTTSQYTPRATDVQTGETFTNSGNISLTYISPTEPSKWTATNTYSSRYFTYTDTGSTYVYNTNGYYSWGAAMVACPKNWYLPTVTQWQAINNMLGTSERTFSAALRGSTYKFVAYGGWFSSSGFTQRDTVGSGTSRGYGHYWTSSQYSTTQAPILYYSDIYAAISHSMSTITGENKQQGNNVRCVTN